ncbi:UNVERIFIED_ORG: transposase-like protein [Burkholderia territorii]
MVFPATTLQTCIVRLIRNSLDYASWKDRRGLAAAIKPIYAAPSAKVAQAELDAFADGPWGRKFPTVSSAWRNAWDRVIPFFAFPPGVRKIIKTRRHFPTDEAATKLIWLALRNITANWGSAVHDWKTAMNQFAILYALRRSIRPAFRVITQPALNTEILTPPSALLAGNRLVPIVHQTTYQELRNVSPLLASRMELPL